ncbi:MAG: LCP family protein [Actinomycetaceae bacterium]|nr:LCP family protein [Actinomycetaceae bacterium]
MVRNTSDQLDEWASFEAQPKPPARRSMLEDELGMQPGEADPHGEPNRHGFSGVGRDGRGSGHDGHARHAEAREVGQAPAAIPASYPPRHAASHAPDEAPRAHSHQPAPAEPQARVSPRPPAGTASGGAGAMPGGTPGGTPPMQPRRKRRRWGRRIFVALLVLIIALVAWPFYLIHYGNGKLEHVDALSDREDTPGTTYLIVGSDKRQAGGIEDGAEGQRADTMMLLQVPESGKPALVSLPRDTYVNIPGHGQNKLNSAYATGGPKLLVNTVEELSGLTVDHYVEVSMGGVKELVDAVGGVNLCLDYDVSDENSGLYWQSGCHDVDGTTALAFSRMRYSDPLGDIGRAMRQRQVVAKLVDKVVSPSTLVNPLRQRRLVGSAASNLTTSKGTGLTNLGRAGLGLRDVMGEGGLVGAPPIASLDYRVRGQSAVLLDLDRVDPFFEKMKNGTLSTEDFYTPPGM